MTRSISRSSYTPWILGGLAVGSLIYGLSRISVVRSFTSSAADSIGDVFSGSSDAMSDLEDSFGFEEDIRTVSSDLGALNRAM